MRNNGRAGSRQSVADFYDYIYYQLHKEDAGSENYSQRKTRALYRMAIKAIEKNLTERERQIFMMKVDGLSQKEIAEELHINPSTVCRSISNSLRKLRSVYDYLLCVKDLFVDD